MMPKVVLHKRNGHRPPPGRGVPSARELLSLVHSAPTSLSDLDVARLGGILSSESDAALAGAPPALASALGRTREALARGELPELRAALDALTSRADLAAGLVDQLADAVRAGAPRAHVARRALVGINEVLLHTLGRYCAEAPETVELSSRLDPQLPAVPGDPRQLGDAFLDLMRAVSRTAEPSGRRGAIAMGTSRREGVLRGEHIVRIVITNSRDGALPADASAWDVRADIRVGRAARIVEEHGGIVSAARTDAGHVHFTIELPAI